MRSNSVIWDFLEDVGAVRGDRESNVLSQS